MIRAQLHDQGNLFSSTLVRLAATRSRKSGDSSSDKITWQVISVPRKAERSVVFIRYKMMDGSHFARLSKISSARSEAIRAGGKRRAENGADSNR